jgi:NodT family efflux transporter outer membrane factor (OMF) lipoprotein
MRLKLQITAMALVATCGCHVGPEYRPPDMAMPDRYAWTDSSEQSPPEEPTTWWQRFNDPVLDGLMAQATRGNFDLRIAAERIDQYRAQYGIASADLYPDIGALAEYTRNREPGSDLTGTGLAIGGSPYNSWQVGLDASWEVDLFGRISRAIEAATGDLQASIEDWRYAVVTLRAEVASSYITIRTLQTRLAVANRDIASQERFVALVQSQVDAGTETESQLAQARSQLASTESLIPQLGATMATEISNLALLLGTTPGPLAEEIPEQGGIPDVPSALAVGIPADLLRRRPDVRAAERSLAAATARIGQATANLYPKLTLSGSFGFGATSFSDLFQWASRTYSAGPAVSWDFFNGGRLRSVVNQQESMTRQALLGYEQAVTQAIGEVESSLAGFALGASQRDKLAEAAGEARLAYELSLQQYEHGVTDFLTVITVQQTLLEAEDSLAQAQGLCAETLVELYRALGGGWTPGALPTLVSETKESTP